MKQIRKLNKLLFMIIITIVFCSPIYFLLIGSIKGANELVINLGAIVQNNQEVSWSVIPLYPTLRHYLYVLFDTPEFWVLFWNSCKIVGLVLIGQFCISVPAAWGFARFPGNKGLFKIYILLMLIPFQVKMVSEYMLLNTLNILDSHIGIIVPALFSTYPVFIIYQFFISIPNEIIEAARIDGASEWTILKCIGIPLGKSGICSALILSFIEYWNLIEQPMIFLKTKSLWPLSLYMPEITATRIGISFCISIITLILPLLFFLFGQEYLQKGISAFLAE